MQQGFEAGKPAQSPHSPATAAQLLPGQGKQAYENSPILKFSHANRIVIFISFVNRYLSAYGFTPLVEGMDRDEYKFYLGKLADAGHVGATDEYNMLFRENYEGGLQ
jgi:hypothetical protein